MGTSWTPGPGRPTNGLRPFGPQVAAAARRKRRRQIRLARTAVLFVAVAVVLAWLTGGFTGNGGHKTATKPPPVTRAQPSTTTTSLPAGPVNAQYLSVHIPTTLSRAVVAADGTGVLILGGLDNRAKSSATVYRFDPQSSSIQVDGALAVGAHDATGVKLGGAVLIFGGGSESTGLRSVQSYQGGKSTVVGSLPQARSDLSSVVVGSEAIVLGGYTGTSMPTSVLATSDGSAFRVVAQLPVPVRYAAVAAWGNTIYVIGGEDAGVATNVIQAVDVKAGTAMVAGHLPATLTQETAFTLGGSIYLAGGRSAGKTTNAIWRFTPGPSGSGSGSVVTAGSSGSSGSSAGAAGAAGAAGVAAASGPQVVQEGTLPEPVADAPVAVIGQTAYLFGGETPSRSSAIVAITPAN